MEIELKYLIEDESLIDKIFHDEYLQQIKDKDSEEEIQMRGVYFDTVDKRLRRAGITFRVRKEASRIIATLKWDGSSDDGMHKREEINVPVEGEINLIEPKIEIFSQSQMAETLAQVSCGKKLVPIVEIKFLRKQMRVDTGSSISELSIDRGLIICGEKTAPISEMEIELYSGSENDMKALGTKLANKYLLKPENKSKYKRGLDLIV